MPLTEDSSPRIALPTMLVLGLAGCRASQAGSALHRSPFPERLGASHHPSHGVVPGLAGGQHHCKSRAVGGLGAVPLPEVRSDSRQPCAVHLAQTRFHVAEQFHGG